MTSVVAYLARNAPNGRKAARSIDTR